MNIKKIILILSVSILTTSCASWFNSSEKVNDNPAVGGRQDSSDMLFGYTNNMPADANGTTSKPNASAAQ